MENKHNNNGWKCHFAWGIDHKSSNSTSQVNKKIPPLALWGPLAEVWIFIILQARHSFYGLGIPSFGFRYNWMSFS